MSTWTAPITFTVGQTVTAAQANAEIRDHALFLKGALDLITESTTADTGTATYLEIVRASSGQQAVGVRITGDTALRLELTSDGSVRFTGGSGTVDARFYRTSAGHVALDSNGAAIDTAVSAIATAGQRGALAVLQDSDTVARAVLYGDGTLIGLELGPGGAAARDTNLYRSTANTLKTDDVLIAAATGLADASNFQIVSGTIGAGLTIGGDANLYRSAANFLKSDDHIQAVLGVGTFTKAGAISDADWAVAPPVGTIAIDTTNFKVYIRTSAATWKSSAAFT